MRTTLMVVAMLTVVLALSWTFMRAIAAFATSDLARRHRTRKDRPNTRISRAAHREKALTTSILSTGLVSGVTLGFGSRLFAEPPVGALRTMGEAVAILAIYDLGYYLFHRFLLHAWSVGRRIHAVHHSIRTPFARDSLYVHPAETAGGVALFLGSAALIAPVGVWSFGVAFLVYSVVNVWVHSAIDVPTCALCAVTALVRHHDIHHESMKSGYYASITPLWDVMLGTARRSAEDDSAPAGFTKGAP
jgi:sterol desaturase/sphingolipid hydroxylase (fatty acid hydroxylase superfamily)